MNSNPIQEAFTTVLYQRDTINPKGLDPQNLLTQRLDPTAVERVFQVQAPIQHVGNVQ